MTMNRTDFSFMLDETQCMDDLTARFPRTLREAFGHYHQPAPLRRTVTFLPKYGSILGAVAVVALLAACVAGAN